MTCATQYYDLSSSSTVAVANSTSFSLTYGSASLEGFMVTDVACLDTTEEMCAEEFEFYAITKETGLDGIDGILGLSPPDESRNGPSYMKALYRQGVIKEAIASFWLNWADSGSSSVTFGGEPEGATTGETHTQKLDVKNDMWWTVTLGSVEYGG